MQCIGLPLPARPMPLFGALCNISVQVQGAFRGGGGGGHVGVSWHMWGLSRAFYEIAGSREGFGQNESFGTSWGMYSKSQPVRGCMLVSQAGAIQTAASILVMMHLGTAGVVFATAPELPHKL